LDNSCIPTLLTSNAPLEASTLVTAPIRSERFSRSLVQIPANFRTRRFGHNHLLIHPPPMATLASGGRAVL